MAKNLREEAYERKRELWRARQGAPPAPQPAARQPPAVPVEKPDQVSAPCPVTARTGAGLLEPWLSELSRVGAVSCRRVSLSRRTSVGVLSDCRTVGAVGGCRRVSELSELVSVTMCVSYRRCRTLSNAVGLSELSELLVAV